MALANLFVTKMDMFFGLKPAFYTDLSSAAKAAGYVIGLLIFISKPT